MRLVTPVLRRVVYPGLARTGYFYRHASSTLAVLTYHGVFPRQYEAFNSDLDGNPVTADCFRRQLQLLKSRYNVISPEEFRSSCNLQKPFPPGAVLLTCDDGLENVLTCMVPILKEQDLSCLFFVLGTSLETDRSLLWYEELYLMLKGVGDCELQLPEANIRVRVSGPNETSSVWRNLVREFSRVGREKRKGFLQEVRIQLGLPQQWNEQYKSDAVARSRFCLLTRADLKRLTESGMSVGAHTMSHPILSMQASDEAWAEISESRQALEQVTGGPVWALAYPFGDSASVGEREFDMARRAGFECAFLNTEHFPETRESPFALPRIHVTAKMNLGEFEAHVSGFYRSMRGRFVSEERANNLKLEGT